MSELKQQCESEALGTCADFPNTPHAKGTCENCDKWSAVCKPHKWEIHSVTEVNGAGVQTEYWEECVECGDMRNEFEAPYREFCPGSVKFPTPLNGFGEPYDVAETASAEESMSDQEKIERLLATHYRIMATKRPFYNPQWLAATTKLCVMASDLRHSLKEKP